MKREEIESSVDDLIKNGLSNGMLKSETIDGEEAYRLNVDKKSFINVCKEFIACEKPDTVLLGLFARFLESKYIEKCYEEFPEFMFEILEQETFVKNHPEEIVKYLWNKIYHKTNEMK